MNDILSELTGDQPAEPLSNDQLGALGDAVDKLIAKRNEIAAAEEKLKQLRAEERKMDQADIPTMMTALRFEKITLLDGRSVTVADSVQCSIPAAVRPDAHAWMDEHNHGDLIKTGISLKFGRADKDGPHNAMKALEAMGMAPSKTESVHPGTLKAWARTELEQGHSLPANLFKVHVVKQTKIK